MFLKEITEVKDIKNRDNAIVEVIHDAEDEGDSENDIWHMLYEKNHDFYAYLKFDSGLIETPVVQSEDNNKYLKLAFDSESSSQGTPFIDYRYEKGDDNMVIYGHNVLYDKTVQFSSLVELTKQDSYVQNSTFTMLYEDGIKHYEITYVYEYDLVADDEKCKFQQTVFGSKEEFDKWIQLAKDKNKINSIHGDIEYGDKFITFQTCKNLNDNIRYLILAKEVVN